MSTPSSRPDPADPAPPIDLAHLHGQTCGDRALQAELLDLFAHQAARILADLSAASGAAPAIRQHRADLLHRLCGSARAIGAWEVAQGAERLEREERCGAPDPGPVSRPPAGLAALDDSVTSARAAIDRLRDA